MHLRAKQSQFLWLWSQIRKTSRKTGLTNSSQFRTCASLLSSNDHRLDQVARSSLHAIVAYRFQKLAKKFPDEVSVSDPHHPGKAVHTFRCNSTPLSSTVATAKSCCKPCIHSCSGAALDACTAHPRRPQETGVNLIYALQGHTHVAQCNVDLFPIVQATPFPKHPALVVPASPATARNVSDLLPSPLPSNHSMPHIADASNPAEHQPTSPLNQSHH